jgi:hypothetical protein
MNPQMKEILFITVSVLQHFSQSLVFLVFVGNGTFLGTSGQPSQGVAPQLTLCCPSSHPFPIPLSAPLDMYDLRKPEGCENCPMATKPEYIQTANFLRYHFDPDRLGHADAKIYVCLEFIFFIEFVQLLHAGWFKRNSHSTAWFL